MSQTYSVPSAPSEQTEPSSPERSMLTDASTALPDNQEMYCKLILSNILAGSLIGKSGSTISAIRNKSGANIRISNVANIYSPDRLALISGTKESLANALDQVVELGSQPHSNESSAVNGIGIDNGISMKMVIPKSSVSLLIGKRGERIHDMRQVTGAKIHVSTKEEIPVPTVERIVKIVGNDVHSVSTALLLVVTAIQSDSQVKEQHNFGPEPNQLMPTHSSPLGHYSSMHQMAPYPSGSQQMMNGFAMGHRNSASVDYCRIFGMEPWMTERNCEIFMQVPDAYVGMLVGKSGQHITDIKLQSNAKIEISKKGDFVEGTNDRLVTISGSIISVHAAHARLMRRILELQQQDTRASTTTKQSLLLPGHPFLPLSGSKSPSDPLPPTQS